MPVHASSTKWLRDDPQMLPLLVERHVAVVLTHRRGRSDEKYEGPAYRNVVEDVRAFLLERAQACEAAGIAHDRIALDPGIGFGKSVEENLALIAGSGRLAAAGYPVLVGSSRKGFIGRLTSIKEPRLRDPASVWLAIEAARHGAAILRVHDVAGTRQALAVWTAMR
jgi:dihydropteroate synthase